jgi:hypothetical protein
METGAEFEFPPIPKALKIGIRRERVTLETQIDYLGIRFDGTYYGETSLGVRDGQGIEVFHEEEGGQGLLF